ncbi:MAG: sensor histidine kinase KdpD [Anaerolineales bacterium]|nr:sensor histidine kinase KdpD [Anaerolineales bacterium]
MGYAPGVGKSTAVLEAAQRRRQEGKDVVLAQMKAHGRSALAVPLLTDLERMPSWPETGPEELVVDAVLTRAPQIAVIDELAHRNGTGARHPHRYQDVEELLNAGIDVYTTLNVYHIESLNDIVAQITGVRFQETVPDRLIEQAAQIELIDILPEDLITRRRETAVSPLPADIPDETFFRLGNLTALRELALRQVARRVDEQMRDYMQTRDIPGPWAASERLLVCVSANPMSARLVRAGYRLAQEMGVTWYVVYVEIPSQSPFSEADQGQLYQTMNLAEGLGAQVVTITGQSIPDTLLAFARQNNITRIIIGQPLRSRWQELVRGSIVNRLIRRSGSVDVHVISSQAEEPAPILRWPERSQFRLAGYLQALFILTFTTLAGIVVNAALSLNPANLVMFFLLAVVIVAYRLGYGPAVMTAVLSVIAFNFFFVPPRLTMRVADAEYLLTFLGLLVAGVVIANLTAHARRQTDAAQRRERETAQLYSLTRELSATVDPAVIMQTVRQHAQQTFQCEVALFFPQEGRLEARVLSPAFQVDQDELAVATWAFQQGQPAGRGTETLSTAVAHYVPLKTAQRVLGVLGLMLPDPIPLDQQRLINAFATQAAQAIEATQLGEEARQTQVLREKEKLQSALLSSISHDLRTPLVSITGTLSSLRENDTYFDPESRRELLDGAYQEADRLNRLVGNLLDMSRLESHSLTLKREPYDLQDVIGVARAQLRDRLAGRDIRIDLPPDLPLVSIDMVLFAQVLVNLLDNAVKYSEPHTPIEICACYRPDRVILEVADHGIGIPEEEIPHIFEKFYRAHGANGRGGSGLGLSICQGIVESHNGVIRAENRKEGGTCFIIELPLN